MASVIASRGELSRFPAAELAERRARVTERMAAAGLDGIVVVSPVNLYWLTGYDAWSFYVPQAALLDASGTVRLVVRHQDVPCGAFTTHLGEDELLGYPEALIGGEPSAPYAYVAAVARELGWGTGARVGVEMDAFYFSANDLDTLARGLVGVELVDQGLLVDELRLVKSPLEIVCLEEAARVASHAMRAALGSVVPGRSEVEIAAETYAAQTTGTVEIGGHRCDPPLVASGGGTAAAHAAASGRRLGDGDTVNVELWGCRHRYYASMARTMAVGAPSPALRALADATLAGLDAALAAMTPGTTCGEVEAAWRGEIGAAGYRKGSRIGYPAGIRYEPTTPDRVGSIRAGSDFALEVGMAFHVMCGMWGRDASFVVSEPVVVDAGGVRLLGDVPRDLLAAA